MAWLYVSNAEKYLNALATESSMTCLDVCAPDGELSLEALGSGYAALAALRT